MSFKDQVLGIFGWQTMSPPKNKSKDPDSTGLISSNVYESYNNFIRPPYERRRAYAIYDELDELSDVSSVLDAYAEDATQYSRDQKSTVWITAKSKKVKTVLTDMCARLKIEDVAEAAVRDIAKYGDDFAELTYKEGEGITGLDWKDPRDIERVENSEGILVGFEKTDELKNTLDKLTKSEKVKYTFKPWDIVHFRLYRRKRVAKQKYRNIYGTSLLAGSERVGKQLKIMDDMLAVHRLTQSLDRRIYKVDTGNASVEEEVQILKRWKNALKRKAYIDPSNNRLDSSFDPYAFVEDLFWPVRRDSNSSVDSIPGNPNVNEIVDIEYFRDKFYGSLRAPKAHFGYEGDIDSRASLSSQDMRFGRACNSVQKAFKNGMTRLCQIELALHNIDPYSEFNVEMVVPSVLEDLSRLEAIQTVIDSAERMASLGETLELNMDEWRKHIMSSVLAMSDQEIKQYSVSDETQGEPDDVDDPDADEPESVDPKHLDELVGKLVVDRLGRAILHSDTSEVVNEAELPKFDGQTEVNVLDTIVPLYDPSTAEESDNADSRADS